LPSSAVSRPGRRRRPGEYPDREIPGGDAGPSGRHQQRAGEISGHLQRAFPDDLDQVGAAALVGAFIGAVSAALQVLLDDPAALADPDSLRRQLRQATDIALRPWQ
jgi:hypothetical protein